VSVAGRADTRVMDAMDALDLVGLESGPTVEGAPGAVGSPQKRYPRSAVASKSSVPSFSARSPSSSKQSGEEKDVAERAGRIMYEKGRAMLRKKGNAGAAMLFLEGARAGHVECVTSLGGCYERGEGGVDADPGRAVALYLKAAEVGGSVRAMYALGRCYEHGIGAVASTKRAETWYLAGCCLARQRQRQRQRNGEEKDGGGATTPARPNTGRKSAAEEAILQREVRVVEREVGAGCFALGSMFESLARGKAGRHARLMARWYAKAAWIGHVGAMEQLGALYEMGSGGMDRRPAVAMAWYQQAMHAQRQIQQGDNHRGHRSVGQQTNSKRRVTLEARMKRIEDVERASALVGRQMAVTPQTSQHSSEARPRTAPQSSGVQPPSDRRLDTLRELVMEVIDIKAERGFDRLVQDEIASRVANHAGNWAAAVDADLAAGDGLYRLVEMLAVLGGEVFAGRHDGDQGVKLIPPSGETGSANGSGKRMPRPATAAPREARYGGMLRGSLAQFVAQGKTPLEAKGGAKWAESEAAQARRVLSAREANKSGFRPGDWRSDKAHCALGKAYDRRSKLMTAFRRGLIAAEKSRTLRALKKIEQTDGAEG